MSVRAVLFALALLSPSLGNAGYQTGNDLMDHCEKDYDVCYWYLMGVADTTRTLSVWGGIKPPLCDPVGTSGQQLRQVFLNWMRKHPQQWHLSASGLALNALGEAWPCK